MKVEKGLFYTEDHEWVKVEGNEVTIGLTDYAQDHLGDIVYVEVLFDVDDEVEAGDDLVAIESVKAASDIVAPFAGTVTELNEELEDAPEELNNQPYEAWIVKMNVEDVNTDDLLSDEDYQKMMDELED